MSLTRKMKASAWRQGFKPLIRRNMEAVMAVGIDSSVDVPDWLQLMLGATSVDVRWWHQWTGRWPRR
jgi:hypothetical protein